ncbi:hypothetical protein CRENBAI_017253 [Crenichthys baileyi]|uniref:Uncharacterized protein n=1 Tax=Crenichthys baileyi TaxID=28760 RepID=A0AAV9QQB3_9TELE
MEGMQRRCRKKNLDWRSYVSYWHMVSKCCSHRGPEPDVTMSPGQTRKHIKKFRILFTTTALKRIYSIILGHQQRGRGHLCLLVWTLEYLRETIKNPLGAGLLRTLKNSKNNQSHNEQKGREGGHN